VLIASHPSSDAVHDNADGGSARSIHCNWCSSG
jgi:hypothetical protein